MLNRKSAWTIGYYLAQGTLDNPDIVSRLTESWQVQEMIRGYKAGALDDRDPCLELLGLYDLPSAPKLLCTVTHDNRIRCWDEIE